MVFFATFNVVFAQGKNKTNDVVYLTNGSIIRGEILENSTNERTFIQTTDGSVMVYEANEVHKTSKSTITKSQKKRYSYISTNLGVSSDNSFNIGFHLNLVELNIAAQNGWGGSLKWGAHAFPTEVSSMNNDYGWITISYSPATLGLGYIMAGPSYSISSRNEKFVFVPRVLIGILTPVLSSTEHATINGNGVFVASPGASVRFFAHKRWNLLAGIDVMLSRELVLYDTNIGVAFNW